MQKTNHIFVQNREKYYQLLRVIYADKGKGCYYPPTKTPVNDND